MKLEFFEKINIPVPKGKIYLCLGFSKKNTQLSENEFLKYEADINLAVDKLDLKGASIMLDVKENNSREITLDGDIRIKSNLLAKFLSECSSLLFIGITAGSDIIEMINAEQSAQDLSKAVVTDAVASEMVDSALSWIAGRKARDLRRQNKFITEQRISAGYGDFNIQYQKVIYDLLKLNKLGVRLTENYIFDPEKSVTAVYGIKSGAC